MVPDYDPSSNTLRLAAVLTRETLVNDGWMSLDAKVKQQLQGNQQASFNLSALENADSAGLAWLINFKRDAALQQVNIIFSSVPDKLAKLAALSSVDDLLISDC